MNCIMNRCAFVRKQYKAHGKYKQQLLSTLNFLYKLLYIRVCMCVCTYIVCIVPGALMTLWHILMSIH